MPHLVAPDVTSVRAVSLNNGATVHRITDPYAIAQAVSTSISVALMALPPGAEVIDGYIMLSSTVPKDGSGAYGIRVYNSLTGDNYIPSATAATLMRFNPSNMTHVGRRLTASSNIVVHFVPGFGTGGEVSAVASCASKLAVSYTTRLGGD